MKNTDEKFIELEKNLGYSFKNKKLLRVALTHTSYANERRGYHDNERLEFLGDSILEFVTSDFLFKKNKSLPEGELTKIRASIVCEHSLKTVADSINLGKFILLGKGEKNTGGSARASILADAVEAIIAAIYIDSNIFICKKVILSLLHDNISKSIDSDVNDFKSYLQEVVQQRKGQDIHYELVKEVGPDHKKEFYVQALSGDRVLGEGKGTSKKRAEMQAAKNALESLKI